jgi:hypothetical protein
LDHRGVEFIPDNLLTRALSRVPLNHFVIWTGELPNCQRGSLRARALACVREAGKPLSFRRLIQRAARLDGDIGLHPESVREAIRQHQSAKPAVLWLVERQPSGDYTAVTDILYGGSEGLRIPAGALVVSRTGRLCIGAPYSTAENRRRTPALR